MAARNIVTIAIALTFAALFTQGTNAIKGAGFYRIVFFFPQVISAVIVGMLWSYVYHPNIGLLNGVLGAVGLCDEHDLTVITLTLQARLRLPLDLEATLDALAAAVETDGFDSLYTRVD